MEQLKIELTKTATLADMISVCDDLAAQGLNVHIEYHQAQKKITVYGTKTTMEIEKLKERYAQLARNPQLIHDPQKWQEYKELMQELERQLVEAGVEL